MNYYLVVGNAKKGTVIDFSKLEEYKKLNSTNLKDIVAFTSSFAAESDLALYLKYKGIIAKEDENLTFGIYRKKEDGKIEKLKYGISFKNDIKYFNVNTLRDYILGNIHNPKFFSSFIGRYYSIYNAKMNSLYKIDALHLMPSIYSSYEYYINNGRFLNDTLDTINEFIIQYCKNYANLRDLAMFVIDYKRKLHHVKSNLEIIKELKEELSHVKQLLQSTDLTEEQKIAYTEKMKNIESDIEMRYGR